MRNEKPFRAEMKILFVSHSSVSEYHQQKLVILAEKYKHEIFLVTPPSWYEAGENQKLYTGNAGIKYIPTKAFVIKEKLFHFYFNAEEIVKAIAPDIVHIEEEPYHPACYQFLMAAKKHWIKAIFFTWENINQKFNPLSRIFYRYNLKNADRAIAGNSDGRGILRENGFNRSVEVIPQYGINMEDYTKKENILPEQGENIDLCFAGRLIPEKGLITVLQAIKDLPFVRFHIAGSGDKYYTLKLKNMAKYFGIEERVIFCGSLKREEMKDFLNKMHILILPSVSLSRWKEQFGRVIIEAFASGVAVIGSTCGEIPNVIADAGFIFKEENPEDLKKKILELTQDKKLFKDCVEKGYNRVNKNYTNEIIAGQIDAIYREMKI